MAMLGGLMLWPAHAHALTPFGNQKILVIFMEHPHAGAPNCPASSDQPACPRHTATDWQPLLQAGLNGYLQDASYGRTSASVTVLVDRASTDGWWPTPHSDAEYAANGSLWNGDAAIGRDAGEAVVGKAIDNNYITPAQLADFHRLLIIDNYHAHQGQTAGIANPFMFSVPVHLGGRAMVLPWDPTVAIDAEGADDADALSILEHELGHQLGEPDLYSDPNPCEFSAPGEPIASPPWPGSDCVGGWDHMALDWDHFPGLGGLTRTIPGWISDVPSQVRYLDRSFSGSVTLSALEQPDGQPLLLRVPDDPVKQAQIRALTPSYFRGFQAECRRQLGQDVGLAGSGVLLTYIDTTRFARQMQVVVRRTSTQAVDDAIMRPGDSYSVHDAYGSFTMTYRRATADQGCIVDLNYDAPVASRSLTVPIVPQFSRVAMQRPSFGGTISGSVFGAAGVAIGAAGKHLFAAPNPCPDWAACGGLVPPRLGHRTSAAFGYSIVGGGRPGRARATVSVTGPMEMEAACPGDPVPIVLGRRVATVDLPSVRPGSRAVAEAGFTATDSSSIGVTVDFGHGLLESSALAFQTHVAGSTAPVASRIVVIASRRCHRALPMIVSPLSLPKGWSFAAQGDETPVRPGERRTVQLILRAPRSAAVGTIDVPVAVDLPADSLGPGSPPGQPYASADPELVGGIDILARVTRPGHAAPAFALPPPLPIPSTPTAYPRPIHSTVSLACPSGAVANTSMRVSGTLSPTMSGIPVRIVYTQADGTKVIGTVLSGLFGSFIDSRSFSVAGPVEIEATIAGGELVASASPKCRTVIAAPPPVTTSLTLQCPSSAAANDPIAVTGALTPVLAGAPIQITYTSPSGSAIVDSVITDEAGSYSDAALAAQVGTWTIRASYAGDSGHEGSSSPSCTTVVSPVTTTLTVQCPATASVQSPIHIIGALAPGFAGAQIEIAYTPPKGPPIIHTTTTDSFGDFSDAITASQKGTWKIQASFPGDSQHEAATSSTCTTAVS